MWQSRVNFQAGNNMLMQQSPSFSFQVVCHPMASQTPTVREGTGVYNIWHLTLTQGIKIRRWSSTVTTRLHAVGTKVRFFHKSPTYFLCSCFSVLWLSFDSGATSSCIISGKWTGSWPSPAVSLPLGACGRKTWWGNTSTHTTSDDNCIVIINYSVFFLVFFILLHRSTQTM